MILRVPDFTLSSPLGTDGSSPRTTNHERQPQQHSTTAQHNSMCGRYALPVEPENLPQWIGAAGPNVAVERVENAAQRTRHRYNIAPTEHVPVYFKSNNKSSSDNNDDNSNNKNSSNERNHHRDNDDDCTGVVMYMRWGLIPHWIKSEAELKQQRYATFNARYEHLTSSRLWKTDLQNRCVVPIQGYYEWETVRGKKTPYYIHRRDDKPMFLAGLYNENPMGADGKERGSFTMITNTAPEYMKWLHPRMPVVLEPSDPAFNAWLGDEEVDLEKTLRPYAHEKLLEWYRVDPGVGNVRNDSETFTRRLPEPLQGLFRGVQKKRANNGNGNGNGSDDEEEQGPPSKRAKKAL
jgi:putative SOS response-associated peptidase YedK